MWLDAVRLAKTRYAEGGLKFGGFEIASGNTIQLYLTTLATHNKSWFPGGA